MAKHPRFFLPNELLLDIFSLLSGNRNDLYNLLFLCRSFRIAIERLLYEEMTDWLYSSSYDGFVSTINGNPRLASYVRHFGCIERFGNTQGRGLERAKEISKYWETVFDALSLMSNLKSFIINLYVPMHLPPITRLLGALKDKELHTLIWGPGIYDMEDMPALISFLHTHQQSLRILRMEASNESNIQPLGPRSCPELEGFGGAWADILSVSSGRKKKIKSLSWFKSPWDELPAQANLDGGLLTLLNGLEELSLYHCFLGPLLSGTPEPSFPFFLDKCPNLRHLHVEIDQILNNIATIGSAFVCLESITLDTSAGCSGNPDTSLVASVFSACSTLKFIDVGPVEISLHSGRPLEVIFMYERLRPVWTNDVDAEPRGETGSEEESKNQIPAVVSSGLVEKDAGSLFRYLPLFRVVRNDRRYQKE